MEAIRMEGLTKKYKDVVAVDGLHLSVDRGELLSLLGVNGAGKTTTIKMLSCLTRPTEGDAFLHGKSICTDSAAVRSLIAVSPQETAVAPGLSVRENLALICGIYRFDRKKQEKKIAELSELLGLGTVLSRKAGKLSGGWQRRLSIAMALISEPKILFLDEPTIGLDAIASKQIRCFLKEINREKGTTILLTSHYMEDIKALCDRTVVINHGTKIYDGGTQEMFEHYHDDVEKIYQMEA